MEMELFLFVYNILRGFFIMKVVENSPQNAQNSTISNIFLGGACPQTPLATARSFAARDGMYIQNLVSNSSFYANRLKKGLLLRILRNKKVHFLEFFRKTIKKDSHLRIFTLYKVHFLEFLCR